MSWLSSPALASPDWIRPYAQPFADRVGLPQLGPTLHLALYSCVTSFALQKLSSVVSPLSRHYPKTRRKQDDWDLHIVSPSPLSFLYFLHFGSDTTSLSFPSFALTELTRDYHQVGWVFSLFAAPLAFHLLRNPSPELGFDPLTGSALREERLSAIAAGYFVWVRSISVSHTC